MHYLFQAHNSLEKPPRRRVFHLTPTFLCVDCKIPNGTTKEKKDEAESMTEMFKKLKWDAPNSNATSRYSNIEVV